MEVSTGDVVADVLETRVYFLFDGIAWFGLSSRMLVKDYTMGFKVGELLTFPGLQQSNKS